MKSCQGYYWLATLLLIVNKGVIESELPRVTEQDGEKATRVRPHLGYAQEIEFSQILDQVCISEKAVSSQCSPLQVCHSSIISADF